MVVMAQALKRLMQAVMVGTLFVGLLIYPAQTAWASAQSGVLRTLNWEQSIDHTIPGGAPSGFVKQWPDGHGPTLVTSPARDGSYAARFQLDVDDAMVSSGKRNEISQRDEQPPNVDRWYGFSVRLPGSWVYDDSAEIVSQWHQCDDASCGGGSPPLALLTDEGRWKVDFRGQIVDLDAYSTDTWTDWVFHVNWRTDSAGVLEVWRDGTRVMNLTGATYSGGPRSPYFKFGIYKWDWNDGQATQTRQRVMYYDALRLGDGSANLADVDPSQGGTSVCANTYAPHSASATTFESVNPPQQAIDGNFSTRWSGQGYGASLILDLGVIRSVCGSQVAWYQGDLRWNDYTVYTSLDGLSYSKAWEGRSSQGTSGYETRHFTNGARNARYVKISFWGNSIGNGWASITEARVVG
jgi:hypothetical protein